jgi:hypothetical protein
LELEEDIQQEMEKFREEVDKNGQQAIGSNLNTVIHSLCKYI